MPQEAADGAVAGVAARGHAPQLRVELDVELLVLVELVLRLRLALEARREAEVHNAQHGGEEGGHVEAAAAEQADGGGEPDRSGGGEAVDLGRVDFAVRAALGLRALPDGCGARKPTPDGMAALTREASQPIVPSTKANIELKVKTHAPRHTLAIVRMPAGRSARRRSKPMMLPISIDMRTRQHASASQGLSPSSTS